MVTLSRKARSTKQNKAVQKQMEILMTNEDFLTTVLSDENKKRFLDYVNAWSISSIEKRTRFRIQKQNNP